MDSVSPTVFCIGEAGDLIKWFDCSDYMREPSDIAISGNEYFVCDFKVIWEDAACWFLVVLLLVYLMIFNFCEGIICNMPIIGCKL